MSISTPILLTIACNSQPWMRYTLPRLEHLAALMGYEYVQLEPRKGMAATWSKLALLEPYLNRERVFIVDADIMPNFAVLTPEDLEHLGSGNVMVPDMGIPVRDERFLSWCRKWLRTVPEIGGTYYNAGLMSFPSETAKVMFREFRSMGNPPNDYFFDQDLVNHTIGKLGIEIAALPTTMNWMAPDNREATLSTAKLIHFAGDHKSRIKEYSDVLPW